MFGDALRKIMRARTVGTQHEIEKFAFRGFHGRHERLFTRIGNRPGRETRVAIGVIRIGARKLGLMDGSVVPAFEQRRINRGRIAIEFHANLESIAEY